MSAVLLINPNTSADLLAMMMAIAAPLSPPGLVLRGVSASSGAAMIVDEAALHVAAAEVLRIGLSADSIVAIIVAAFGDPGIEALRDAVGVPVVGIGEASIAEAQSGGRRFGIATTTPALRGAIDRLVERSALGRGFTGTRIAGADAVRLAADPSVQEHALARAVADCFDLDGADSVVIGGGPLSAAARALRRQFHDAIIEPVPAAMRRVAKLSRPAG